MINNIVIIEDDELSTKILKNLLDKFRDEIGKISSFETLNSALEYLSFNECDVVILDLNLPDSAELNTFLTLHSKFPNIPIVIMTGMDDTEMAKEAIKLGAQEFIIKGLTDKAEILFKIITYAIERDIINNKLEVEVGKRTKELSRTVDFLLQLSKIQNWILYNELESSELYYILNKFSKILNMSRSYVFKKIEDSNKYLYKRLSYWCTKDINSECYNNVECDTSCDISLILPCSDLENVPYAWHIAAINKRPVCLKISTIPTKLEKIFFEKMSIKSVVFIPVIDKEGNSWGFVGFDECKYEREWSDSELSMLLALGSLIGWVEEKLERDDRIRELSYEFSTISKELQKFSVSLKNNSLLENYSSEAVQEN